MVIVLTSWLTPRLLLWELSSLVCRIATDVADVETQATCRQVNEPASLRIEVPPLAPF